MSDRLRQAVLRCTPEQLTHFARRLDPDDLATLESIVAELDAERQIADADYRAATVPWRQNPSLMAHHLEGDRFQLYPYVDYLGHKFRQLETGEDRFQIWEIGPQYGKGLWVETPIPTPTGWTTMGALTEGDVLFGGDGQPCVVTWAAPVRNLDCYRVITYDGANLIADADHLWPVYDKDRHKHRIVQTPELVKSGLRLPPNPGIDCGDIECELPPYVLGAWLGDGTTNAPAFSTADAEMAELLAAEGYPIRKVKGPYAWSFVDRTKPIADFIGRLRSLGCAARKAIPTAYLRGSWKQRLALLQGLMDTDGTASVGPTGHPYAAFTTTSKVMWPQVLELVRSLGERANVYESRATIDGRYIGPKWTIQWTPRRSVPFRLARKVQPFLDRPAAAKPPTRVGIVSCERVPTVPTRCIAVDSADRTFLAGEAFTVTHNSWIAQRGIAWALDRNPANRYITTSYGSELADRNGMAIRDYLVAHGDQLRVRLRRDANRRDRFQTDQGGGLLAAGLFSGLTGFTADAGIVIDDPYKGWQEGHSAAYRLRVSTTVKTVVFMRRSHGDVWVLLITTRWHESDIAAELGHQLSNELGVNFTVTRMAEIAEAPDLNASDPILRLADPLGRAPGELLCPERFDAEAVALKHNLLGPYLSAGVLQQRPAPAAGTEILREWFQLEETLPPAPDKAITSWDMKLKDKESGDFVVGQCWWKVGGNYWCMDQLRGQWNQATVENAMALMHVRHPEASLHYFENTGNGPEVAAALREAHPGYEVGDNEAGRLGMTDRERELVADVRRRGMESLVPVPPIGDKSVRMRAHAGRLAGGNVHLPAAAAWVPGYLDEMAAFGGGGGHDDQVDATSQALSKLSGAAVAVSGTPQGAVPTRRSGTPGAPARIVGRRSAVPGR